MTKPAWPKVKFGDVVELNKDRIADPEAEGIERYVGIEHIEPQDLRIRSWGLVAEGTTFTNYFQPRQVLFVKRRAYQRKVAVADFSGVCSGDIYVLESKDPEVLLPDLLPFICQTDRFFEHAVGTSAGSLSPRTNWTQLAQFEFPLPPPAEQRRIAEVLWAVEDTLEKLNLTILITKKLRKSAAFNFFEADSSFRRDLAKIISDSLYGPRFSSKLYNDTGPIAQLRTTDIDEDGNISYKTIPRVNLNVDDYKTHLLQDGDLVISRSGTCGITAVFRRQTIPTIAAAFLIRLRTTNDILPEYLHEFFSSPIGQQLTASLSRGGVQKNISGSNLLAQQIPCPSLSRQQEVVEMLTELREAENSMSTRVQNLQNVKVIMLGKLFEKT